MFISYGDFLNMPRDKQRIVVEMIQEFVVEYERVQNLKLEESYKKQKRYQVYKRFLEFISISSAHAFPIAADENVCLYAGNLSTMSGRKCSRPKRHGEGKPRALDNYLTYNLRDDTFYHGNYASNNSLGCSPNDHIVCNPEVFGQIGGSPICVEVSPDIGESASLACARAVAKIEEISNSGDSSDFLLPGSEDLNIGDSENIHCALLDSVVDLMSSDAGTGAVNALHMMADVCLCGRDATSNPARPTFSAHPESPSQYGNTYADFAELMFGNATCVGLLLQIDNLHKYTDGGDTCFDSDVGTTDNAFARWLTIQQQISRLINGSISEELGATDELARGILMPPNPDDMSNTAYRDAVRDTINSADYQALANQRFEEAVDRNLCPISAESYGLRLEHNPEQNTVTAHIVISFGLIPLTAEQLAGINITTPSMGSLDPSTADVTNQQITIRLSELAVRGGTLTACLPVAGFACSDVVIDGEEALPINISVLDGNILRLEYQCDDCGDDTTYTPPVADTSGDLKGFAINGDISSELCPSEEESETPGNVFCASYTPPTEEINISFTGQSENPAKNFAGSENIEGTDLGSLNFSQIATVLREEAGNRQLIVRVGEATMTPRDGGDPVNLLDGDDHLPKLTVSSGADSSISGQFERLDGGGVFLPRAGLGEQSFDVTHTETSAEGSIQVSEIEPSCNLAFTDTGATATLELGDNFEVLGELNLLESPDAVNFTIITDGQAQRVTLNKSESTSTTIRYIFPEDETVDVSGVGTTYGTNDIQLNLVGPTEIACGNLPPDADTTIDEIPEPELASTDACQINIDKRNLVQGQYQSTFTLHASASGGTSAQEDDEAEYIVKIFDLRPGQTRRRDDEADEPAPDRRVIGPSPASEDNDDAPAFVIEDAALRGAVEETKNQRILSSSGRVAVPTEGSPTPLRLVAYRDGIPCATENIDVPVTPITQDVFQGQSQGQFARPAGGFHINQLHQQR